VPRTSTLALSNATLPYVLRIARRGAEGAMAADPGLAKGLNTYRGQVTYDAVAECFNLPYVAYVA
jgi:alanine dehydrogenase